jgi:hypothetical protein
MMHQFLLKQFSLTFPSLNHGFAIVHLGLLDHKLGHELRMLAKQLNDSGALEEFVVS